MSKSKTSIRAFILALLVLLGVGGVGGVLLFKRSSALPEHLQVARRDCGCRTIIVDVSKHHEVVRAPRVGALDQPHALAFEGHFGLFTKQPANASDPLRFEASTSQTIARVARGILEGKQAPTPSSFPAYLRRGRPMEVLVTLRQGQVLRLWRSARANSFASAFLRAVQDARMRWHERETFMGEALENAMPKLDVEVAILREDGTLYPTSERELTLYMTPAHGLGLEHKGKWFYQLPEALNKPRSLESAYRALLGDAGLDYQRWQRSDVRLYRFWVEPVATSRALDARD